VAKSSGFSFIKPAEAAGLNPFSQVETPSQVNKPGLLDKKYIYIIILIFLLIVGTAVVLIGIKSKNSNQSAGKPPEA
jgi:hypothetical protein